MPPPLSRSEEAVAARTKHAWLETARLRHRYPTITPTELAAAYDVVTSDPTPKTKEQFTAMIRTAAEEARAAAARPASAQPLPLIPVTPATPEATSAQERAVTDARSKLYYGRTDAGRRKTRRHRKTRGRRILRRKTSRRKQ